MKAIILTISMLVEISLAEKVLLISMDGFRWDYIQNASTPNFDHMAEMGSKAPFINNTFTTKTFPCHYSIVTGLYEESHGIVANTMYDPEFDERFSVRTKDTKWWNKGEPIWVTARKQGKNGAVYFWVGSETEIQGYRPNIWKPFDRKVPFDERVDAIVSWLQNDTLAIDLALLYFQEPDSVGHRYGPYSRQIKEMVEQMDDVLGSIIKKLDNAGLTDNVDILLTSDHGMTEINRRTRMVDISQYIDLASIKVITSMYGPVINILPQEGLLDEMYTNLTKAQHIRVYRKEEIPDRWHYKNNRRVLPLLLVADDEWILSLNGSYRHKSRGTHGHDNQLMSMKPIFYAKGPRIKKNYVVEPFNSVDIYPFICKLLGIQPAPNNGTLDIIQRIENDGGLTGCAEISVLTVWLLICVLLSHIV